MAKFNSKGEAKRVWLMSAPMSLADRIAYAAGQADVQTINGNDEVERASFAATEESYDAHQAAATALYAEADQWLGIRNMLKAAVAA